MSNSKPRPRKTPKNTYTTSSGKTIKLNRSLTDRMKAGREAKAQRKAAYLSTLPKEHWKRLLWRLEPKRMYHYWFSRDGAIMALKIVGVGFVVCFLLIVGLFAYFRKDLPKIQDINNANDGGGNVSYYDKTGQTLLFHDSGAFKRLPVTGDNISPYMKEATIAVEDKGFYHEGAFNIKGITRAAINNLRGGSTQGGSTITQQLVKLNEGWTSDHTISRKVKELILAVELEREYSKDDILTAYLNMAPYSGTDYGVEAAAQDYFHTSAKNLGLEQSAMLASIPKSPTEYSPYSSPNWNPQASGYYFNENGLLARQQYILSLMANQGYVSQADATAAQKRDIISQVLPMPTDHFAGIVDKQYAYFILAAKNQLTDIVPKSVVKNGDLKVITTLDVGLQGLAEKSLADNATKLHRDKADDASFVAEDNVTGQIVALVGGMNFDTQQVDYASGAPISPGSSIKPYSYTTLINDNNNVGAGSMLVDKQQPLPGYPCDNKNRPESSNPGDCLWDDTRTYYGNVTLRYALGSSLNVPAVKAFTSSDPKDTSTSAAGSSWRIQSINNTMKTVNALMGNTDAYKCYDPVKLEQEGRTLLQATKSDETQCGAAAGIGNEAYTTLVDHVNGIASISRLGQSIPTTLILKVMNGSGKTLEQFQQPKAKQVVKPDSAYIVTDMAADPGASYLSGSCTTTTCTSSSMKFHRYKGWHNAIKTGTNQDLDGLMMSWNTKYTAGVWIGNYDRSPYGGSPENVTDPIMKSFMDGAIDSLGNVKPVNWTTPSGLKSLPAFHSSVPFKSESQPPANDFFPSWYVGKASSSKQLTYDKVSGLIATSCTPDSAKQAPSAATSSSLNVDLYMGGAPNVGSGSSTSTSTPAASAYDNVHSCGDSPPTATITGVCDTTGHNCVSVNGGTTTCPNTGCAIEVHVEQGTHPFDDSQYPTFPGTLSLVVNGQTVQSQPVSSSGDYTLTFTPPAGSSGSIQVTANVTDSVLYQGSDTQSITIPNTTSFFRMPTSGGGSGGGGNPNDLFAGAFHPSRH